MKDRLHALLVAVPLMLVAAACGSNSPAVRRARTGADTPLPCDDARDVAGSVVRDRQLADLPTVQPVGSRLSREVSQRHDRFPEHWVGLWDFAGGHREGQHRRLRRIPVRR